MFLWWSCQASVFSSVLCRLNKNLMWWTLEPSACHSCQTDCVIDLGSWTGRVIALRQISVAAPCYSSILVRKYLENTSLRREDMPTQRCKDKRAPGPLTPLFICIPPPPRGPTLCKLDSPGVFVLPGVLTLVLRPSFVLFSQAFPFFVF